MFIIMIENPLFNSEIDDAEVDQFGFVDMREAIANNVIVGNADINQQSFNNIEDPSTIIGKPRDIFQAMAVEKQAVAANQKATAKAGGDA